MPPLPQMNMGPASPGVFGFGDLHALPALCLQRISSLVPAHFEVNIENGPVCVGPLEGRQLGRHQPRKGRVLAENDLFGLHAADERIKDHGQGLVHMGHGFECFYNLDGQFQFLLQFPPQTLLRGLALFNFAPGKLPLERQTHSHVPLNGKGKTLPADNGAGNLDLFYGFFSQ